MNAKAAKLRRLIEHPSTPEGEREAAARALERLQQSCNATAGCKVKTARAAVCWMIGQPESVEKSE